MKVLVLGGSGMLGHKLWQVCAPRFDTYTTFRGAPENYDFGIFNPSRSIANVLAEDFSSVRRAFHAVHPDVVINCIGIVKQRAAAKDEPASMAVNARFPHQLSELTRNSDARLIHISTDCVFSGTTGNYSEDAVPDAEDWYGRSKLMGEVQGDGCLTIRTSMIGRELKGSHGLLEWFLSQAGGRVRGFRRAIFSGLTTPALAEIIVEVIRNHPELSGVWHVAAAPISKFEVLNLVQQVFHLAVDVEPDETYVCDRSLDGSRFQKATGISAPTWTEMIEQLRADPTPYDRIRIDT